MQPEKRRTIESFFHSFTKKARTNEGEIELNVINSSSSSYESPHRVELIHKPIINQTRRISTDNEADNTQNKIHYRVTIYPSKDHDGEFSSLNDSRIFLRLNDHTKDSYIYKKNTKN